MLRSSLVLVSCLAVVSLCAADEKPAKKTMDANSLAYLDECNPWYPHKDFPKLITPQWVGEEGVEAVIVLAIDDMRDPAKYEQYLRPILNRLKQIDGRAPVSIMTNEVKPDDAQLQSWLGEGLSIECHTIDHPCPILQGGDLPKAKSTYDRCVDLMGTIPGNKPVAFRTPCCDSLNTVSPRFFSEIFSKTTEKGNFLQIDSSVFTFFTSDDESLPKELVLDANDQERFWKYLPKNNKYGGNTHDNFVNYIKNYPYPYVINNSCWEIPCIAPSDWSAQHLHGISNPVTIEDWKAAIDLTVHKQGCFSLVFHPHGWIKPEQVVEMIDHAVAKHGNKVKFLNFREVAERLNQKFFYSTRAMPYAYTVRSMLSEGIRFYDVDSNGYMDVVYGGSGAKVFAGKILKADGSVCMSWQNNEWVMRPFPFSIYDDVHPFRALPEGKMAFYSGPGGQWRRSGGGGFGGGGFGGGGQLGFGGIGGGFGGGAGDGKKLQAPGKPNQGNIWKFGTQNPSPLCISTNNLQSDTKDDCDPIGLKLFVDMNGDGISEAIGLSMNASAESSPIVFQQSGVDGDSKLEWTKTSLHLPLNHSLDDLCFPDIDGNGFLDPCFIRSNEIVVCLTQSFGRQLSKPFSFPTPMPGIFQSPETPIFDSLGSIAADQRGTRNGFFIHDNHFCWINEDTAKLPDLMYRVSFEEALAAAQKNGDSTAEQRQEIAPGASPGNEAPTTQKAPEGRHNLDRNDQSAAPSGLEDSSSTETPGSRPGLSAAVAPRLNRVYSPVPIGAAVVDITPDYPVRLTGYGNRMKESDGVATKIHARALVIGGSSTSDLAAEQRQPIAPGGSPGNEAPTTQKAPEGRHNSAGNKQSAAPSGLEDSSSTETPGSRPGLSAAVASRLNRTKVAVSLRRDEPLSAPQSSGTPAVSANDSATNNAASADHENSARLISAERDGYTVLITVDNCGVPLEMTEAVYERIAAKYNIPRRNFAISSTHSHSAPWLRGFAPNIFAEIPDDHAAHLAQYEKELTDKLVDVVEKAIASQRPGHLSYGFGEVGFAMNRRALANGKWSGFGEVPDGPTDKRVPVLAAHDVDGKLIAVLANYACHCTTETGEFNQISGDWAGFAADMLEADHPGAVALIAIGCGADANPSPRGTHEQAKGHGRTIADEVNRLLVNGDLAAEQRQKIAPGFSPGNNVPNDEEALKGRHISANENESAAPSGLQDSSLNETPGSRPGLSAAVPPALKRINPDIFCNMARIDLPLGPIPSRETWEQQAKEPGVTGSRARYFLQMLDDGKPIPTTIPNYPVQTWCFGDDLAMVFLGGEVVVDYSIRMNDMFDSDRLWINAYSNDVPCYIASARVLREGGYECDSSMLFYRRPTRLAPEAEDVLCDAVQKIMPHKFYSEKLQQDFPAPKSPEESLKTMTTKPDLRVVLAASEPLIRDPVAFDWDERGRLWVVEMGDYPKGDSSASGWRQPSGTAIGPPNSDADVASGIHTRGLTPSARQHRGRVQMLEDTDKNGVYDKATTFLDNLAFPTGIHCWRGGVIITMAPEIFYAEDTDGDGKADVRETMYRGFVEGNQQHRINGLRWGLDGWLYLANGDSGGEIAGTGYVPGEASDETTGRLTPAARQVVNLRGRDLRINPDTNELDALSGQTQFGRERDDFGNWFGNNNSNPIWQYVLEDRYVRRNPHAGISQVTAPVAVVPGAAPVYPTSRTLARFNDFAFANRFTSACSTMIYRDTYLGEQYYGNAFTSEPVHNLVSRLVMTRDGYGFKGERAADEQQSEFLASSDNWFRPTMIRTGPDGAIWVADMYRAVIEHPEWIPPEYQRKMNLYAGSDMGRIYRIVPASECCGENVAVSLRRDEPLTARRDVEKPTAESGKPEAAAADDSVAEQRPKVAPGFSPGNDSPNDNRAPEGRLNVAQEHGELALADEAKTTRLISAERDGYFASAAEQRQPIAPGVSPGRDRPNDDQAPEGRQNVAQEHGEPALADEAKTARLISAERDGYFDKPWNEIPLVQLRQRVQSSNGWWRDTAHRILMHRINELDTRDITALVQAATGDANEAVSVQAGSLLSSICEHPGSAQAIAARAEAIPALLTDARPASRRMGLQMVESTEAERPANDLVMATLEGMTSDEDRSVRLQLALTSGRINHRKTSTIIARLLERDFDDTVIRNAAISSLTPGNIKDVLTATLNLSPENPNEQLIGLLLGQAAAMEQQDALTGPLMALISSLKPDATSARIDSLASTVSSVLNGDVAKRLQSNRTSVDVINAAGSVAQEIALDETTDVDRRAAAIRFAGVSELLTGHRSLDLIQFLTPQTPFALQLSAVQLMGRDFNQEVVDQVVSKWSSLDPAVRAEAMANMLKRENSIGYLLDRIEAGSLSTGDLDASQRDRLINHGTARISERARKVLGEEMRSARSAVVDDFKSQISNLKFEISKDEQAAAGKLVFEKRCATCHRLQDIGKEVGADLAALKDRSTDALLTAILDPNKAVESKFLVYTVVTKDGLQHTGMLKGETGGSLTLIGNDGKEITVVRADIEELVGSQRSLMPEGLEKDLSATDLAHVIAFVQSTGTPWKRFDGNAPKFVAANADGSVTLPASAAEIYGPSLIFEEKYGNLGYWLSADDYARWTFEVPKSGHWTVEFDFACDDSNAGSLIKFSTGNRMLTARVPGSGTWDNYQTWQAGTIDLHRGRGQLIITAPEKPPFALIDLRAVRLIPPK